MPELAYPIVKSENQLGGGLKVWSEGGLTKREFGSFLVLQSMIPKEKEINDKVVQIAIDAADLMLKHLAVVK